MNRRLIVNADDYGLTAGISRGILRGHTDGIVTSTSVIALGPAFDASAPWLGDAPDLGVGIHFAAVGEDPPLLSAAEIPTLVDGRGRLAPSWKQFVRRVALRRVDPADLEREFRAQAARVMSIGSPITHVDTHQHLHLWPIVREVVLRLAQELGVGALRVTRSRGGRLAGLAVNRLARGLRRRAAQCGLQHPDDFAGFDEAGRVDGPARDAALSAFARDGASTAELCVHPGEADDMDRARYDWGYRWASELDALCGAGAHEAVKAHGFALASFAVLAAPVSHA